MRVVGAAHTAPPLPGGVSDSTVSLFKIPSPSAPKQAPPKRSLFQAGVRAGVSGGCSSHPLGRGDKNWAGNLRTPSGQRRRGRKVGS